MPLVVDTLVTAYETEYLVGRVSRHLSPHEIDVWVTELDQDGNGVVDRMEVEHMVRQLLDKDCVKGCCFCSPIKASPSLKSPKSPSDTQSSSAAQTSSTHG